MGTETVPQTQGEQLTTAEFRLGGLDCADCALTIEKNMTKVPGVTDARVDFATAKLTVRYGPTVGTADIIHTVENSGYSAVPIAAERDAVRERPFLARNRRAVFTLISGLGLLGGFAASLLGASATYVPLLYLVALVFGGFYPARAGLFGLVRSRTLDMNVLMTIAIVGAVVIGEWAEAATVAFLFALGNTLESYTMDRARGAIRSLMAIAPNTARVRALEGEVNLPVEKVEVGTVVIVRPGEKIPLDGRVIAGSSSVNQAPVTGESVPVEKGEGDEVYAGTINERGYLEIEVTKPYAENTIAKVIHLVEEAQAQRAPSQRFVDTFAQYYTPAVIALAVAVALVPTFLFGQPFDTWVYRALVLLVIACPCALVISTPVSIVAGIARAATRGALIKGGSHLEEAGSINAVAFDKTGTLTVGRPEVTDVVPLNGLIPAEVLRLAAAVEERSEHPLAAAVRRAAAREGGNGHLAASLREFESITGRGVRAEVGGVSYFVGSPRLFRERGYSVEPIADRLRALSEEGKTVLLVGGPEGPVAILGLADRPRPGAREAVAALREAGVSHIVMLTGDNEETARAIACEVGIDEYRANLLPQDKVAAVKELRQRYGKVAMVGDGVNDAPALAAANIGIAMGVAGSDTALETADVALMANDLGKVPYAMALSRRALATIKQNIAFSLILKAAFLALALPGVATLWLAILADTGASLLVTLNGMRLLRFRTREVVVHNNCSHGECHCHEDHAEHDGEAHEHEHEHDHAHAHAGHSH